MEDLIELICVGVGVREEVVERRSELFIALETQRVTLLRALDRRAAVESRTPGQR